MRARQVHYNSQDCVQWVGRDISARKEMERMRQDLINMLVHDLRGPLGNLINTIELLPMLLNSIEDNPNLKYLLTMARRSGQEVRDLVDSMLDVGRLEEGDVPLQCDLVELEEIIQAVQDQVGPRASSKKMELTFSSLPEIPALWIDGSMIRRVLINLIDNAVKYTPHEGKVSVTITREDNLLRIAIVDNGPGIKKEDQPHIFNKFSRVDHSSKAPSGVGLGLAFCKLAAEAHGGSISVESEGIPGQGSAFFLAIPIRTEEE
jgi:signal transduction histidine kinase